MIDSHSHIYDDAFKEDYFETINRAKIAGVKKIILVGFSEDTNLISYNEMLKHQGFLYSTCGIHPSEVDENYKNKLINLEKFIHEHKTYAIGECGLDYHYALIFSDYSGNYPYNNYYNYLCLYNEYVDVSNFNNASLNCDKLYQLDSDNNLSVKENENLTLTNSIFYYYNFNYFI